MSRDEAIILMVKSNLQRSTILPSEKAFSYKMRLEAMNRQGQRTDLTSTPVVSKSRSNEELGNEHGESREQVRRYIRLTELIPPLLDLVDEDRIAFRPAVELSYLKKEEQETLLEEISYADATPSLAQAIKMKRFSQEGKLSNEVIESIMSEEKPNQKEKINIKYPLKSVSASYASDHYLASPNVFRSGKACIDTWIPFTSSLTTVVDKLVHDMVHDPIVTRYDSMANSSVAQWHKDGVAAGRFPTIHPKLLYAPEMTALPPRRVASKLVSAPPLPVRRH